jgi:shikimate dehydrogenase
MEITGTTKLFVLIADPVEHVQTTKRLNRYFDEKGIDAVCVPLQVRREDLEDTWNILRNTGNLGGVVVTIPHKERVARICDELQGVAGVVQSANVVRRESGGRMVGTMLDGRGFVQGLRLKGYSLEGLKVLIVGAGGVASAIAYELAAAHVSQITIANRTEQKAADLVDLLSLHFKQTSFLVGAPDPDNNELIVNCTSLGMGENDPLPVAPEKLRPEMTVVEVIMVPETTPILQHAESIGCRIVYGKEMNLPQSPLITDFLYKIRE